MGAWIETFLLRQSLQHTLSHPTWVRGLKHNAIAQIKAAAKSHPTWVRGLKPRPRQEENPRCVAPYVGAWIETLPFCTAIMVRMVAPYVGAWIETNIILSPIQELEVAPYVGAWIETSSVRGISG